MVLGELAPMHYRGGNLYNSKTKLKTNTSSRTMSASMSYDEDEDEIEEQNRDEDEDVYEDEDEGQASRRYASHLLPVLEIIIDRVDAMQKPPPDFSQPMSVFRSYWRDVYGQIQVELYQSMKDDVIITFPPIKCLEVQILDDNGLPIPPRCLEWGKDVLTIQSEGEPITRGQLLRAIGEALYGEDGLWSDRRLVVRAWNEKGHDGKSGWQKGSEQMRIWMYCDDVSKPCFPWSIEGGEMDRTLRCVDAFSGYFKRF